MIEKLKKYVDDLFEDAPATKKARELKDELLANLIEKYNDLISAGKGEEEAYNIVVAGIGDLNELISNLKEGNVLSPEQEYKERKRSAKFIAAAVMLYILSIVPVILKGNVALMFVFVAVATGILIYSNASKPRYFKEDETLVEEFKEWKSRKSRKNYLKNSIISAMWTLIVAIYLVVSFAFGIWAYSWIIFIIGAALSQVVKAVFELKEDE